MILAGHHSKLVTKYQKHYATFYNQELNFFFFNINNIQIQSYEFETLSVFLFESLTVLTKVQLQMKVQSPLFCRERRKERRQTRQTLWQTADTKLHKTLLSSSKIHHGSVTKRKNFGRNAITRQSSTRKFHVHQSKCSNFSPIEFVLFCILHNARWSSGGGGQTVT